MIKSFNIINSLGELKNQLLNENVIAAFIICNANFRQVKKKYFVLTIDNTEYVVYKTKEGAIKCSTKKNLFNNVNLKFYDIIVHHFDFSLIKNLADLLIFERKINPSAQREIEKINPITKQQLIKEIYNLKGISNLEHKVIKSGLYKFENDKYAIELKAHNQKTIVDVVHFSNKEYKSSCKNRMGAYKNNLEDIVSKRVLNFVFNPSSLLSLETNTPFILFNKGITHTEIDKILYHDIKPDKDLFQKINFNIVTSENEKQQVDSLQAIHYLLNTLIDYVHFSLEEKKDYINIILFWKRGEGMKRNVRLDIKDSLINNIYRLIYDNHYEHLFADKKFSENIDLLFKRKHYIEKRESNINKKKDVIAYKLDKNCLSLYWYGRYMVEVFGLKNITIEPCLK